MDEKAVDWLLKTGLGRKQRGFRTHDVLEVPLPPPESVLHKQEILFPFSFPLFLS